MRIYASQNSCSNLDETVPIILKSAYGVFLRRKDAASDGTNH